MKFHIVPIILYCATVVFAGDFVVIVNKENAATSLSAADLKRFFTGKKTDLNGMKIVPINLSLESPAATAFLDEIIGQTPDEFREYWLAEQVKGGGSAPMVQKTAEGMLSMISQLPGAIGYVEKAKVTADVKVLKVE